MVYSPTFNTTMPIPMEPAVLSCHITNTAASTNVPIYIPWEYCQLDYSYTVTLVANDATGDVEIDLELDAASGTEMHSITIATSTAAVGVIDEGTVTTQSACENLGRHNTSRDAVNVEVDGGATPTGSFMLYMYFISDYAG